VDPTGIIRVMTRLGLVLLLLTIAAAGCGGNGDSSGGATTASTTATNSTTPAETELPDAVEEKREEIASAAQALDYDRLATLLDPKNFTYSFGESEDPIGYWRRLEREGEVPILGDILPTVLSMPYAKQGNIYAWPSAHGKEPSTWTEEDRSGLRKLYTAKEIRRFERAGAYLGYRAGIQADGTWLYFVAGD
jgi:hypothetical protein